MPTLFEILNRFSKPPVDLWSFYIYMKEHYGGVEYLEFWLDCAAHTALCKEVARGMIHDQSASNAGSDPAHSGSLDPDEAFGRPLPAAMMSPTRNGSNRQDFEKASPSSSVLFDILQGNALDMRGDSPRTSYNASNNASNSTSNEERDGFDATEGLKRYSTVSNERARNKRNTVSRLSEILDNMLMPQYPSATATSPTRERIPSQDFASDEIITEAKSSPQQRTLEESFTPSKKFMTPLGDQFGSPLRKPPATPPPQVTLISQTRQQNFNPTSPNHGLNGFSPQGPARPKASILKKPIHDSALRIISIYLMPKSTKEIELPNDQRGWSMAEDIRQLIHIPGGLDNPKIFESATTYVFEALEREALPGFLVQRALSNVQPVSSTLRLIGGLVALFGAFWLSFVFVLLDWVPKSHRCWVILPFSFGWYLTLTGLYRLDPLLALAKLGEQDGGGLIKVQEKFVWKMLRKRGTFVLVSTVLLSAAFCVLFIFVPGHRL